MAKANKTRSSGRPRYPVPLIDIQDQIGCRVVVKTPEAVERVADTLKRRFHCIENRRRVLSEHPSYFGYDARHMICSIPDRFATNTLRAKRFEIQISTLFQHAWAEMEHDIIYKPKGSSLGYAERRSISAAAALAFAADFIFNNTTRTRKTRERRSRSRSRKLA